MPTLAFTYCIILMFCIKKALLTITLQNSSRLSLYEGNVYVTSLQKHRLWSSLMSAGSSQVAPQIANYMCLNKICSEDDDIFYSELALALITGKSIVLHDLPLHHRFQQDSGFSWAECPALISREPNHAEDGTQEVCSVPVQQFSKWYQGYCSPWHEEKCSLLH